MPATGPRTPLLGFISRFKVANKLKSLVLNINQPVLARLKIDTGMCPLLCRSPDISQFYMKWDTGSHNFLCLAVLVVWHSEYWAFLEENYLIKDYYAQIYSVWVSWAYLGKWQLYGNNIKVLLHGQEIYTDKYKANKLILHDWHCIDPNNIAWNLQPSMLQLLQL